MSTVVVKNVPKVIDEILGGTTSIATITTAAIDAAGNSLDQDPSTLGKQDKTWTLRAKR